MKVLGSLTLCGLTLLSSLSAQAPQGNRRPIAITNARILTMEGPADKATIELGTVLIRRGKIEAVGTKAKVPAGAQVIDAEGGTLMPGLVSAHSRAGLSGRRSRTARPTRGRGRRGGFRAPRVRSSSGPGRNSAATKVARSLYSRQDVFHELLESGVTSLALVPTGAGFPGQGALLGLTGKTREELISNDAAFVAVNPANNTKAKKLLKETFEKAKKLIEERNKPKQTPKKDTEKKPAAKDATKKPTDTKKASDKSKETPKPAPKKEEKKDGKKPSKAPAKAESKPKPKKPADKNLVVVADLLEKKIRGFLTLNTATDVLHYLDAAGDAKFEATILALAHNPRSGELTRVLDQVKKLKAPLLLSPSLSQKPNTNYLTNPAAELHRAGLKIGFAIPDSKAGVKDLFRKLLELVRHGLDADAAMRAVTIVPATMLGIDSAKGSIKVGKDADLILWSGDPLDPLTKQVGVYKGGVLVKSRDEQESNR